MGGRPARPVFRVHRLLARASRLALVFAIHTLLIKYLNSLHLPLSPHILFLCMTKQVLLFEALLSLSVPVLGTELAGNATLGTPSIQRTVIVAQDGSGSYSTIQAAASAARPGDLILVKNGTYAEAPYISVSGTADAAIVFENFPGQSPVIRPPGTDSNSRMTVSGAYIYIIGFEIVNGWDGVVVSGSYNGIIQNNIHNNGDSCANSSEYCGQGIILSSAHDILLYGNNVHDNGLRNYSPSHVHGIYLSDYYGCNCMKNITVYNNQISNHGGGGLHAWDINLPKTALLIQNNVFQNNNYEMVLYQVDSSTITGNTFSHSGHPATDAAIDTILWLEFSVSDTFSNNTFIYSVSAPSSSDYLIYLPSGKEGLQNLTFSGNRWILPASLGSVTDAMVMASVNGT